MRVRYRTDAYRTQIKITCMKTIHGTSASGRVKRMVHVRKHGTKLMLNIARPDDLFNRDGAVVVSAAELLRKIAAANKEQET